jgi:HD-like signal output (HDOD) protein
MADNEAIEYLRKIPMVADLPAWKFDAIVDHVALIKLKKGAKVVERGSDDGYTYFLIAGRVSLECDGSPPMVIEANAESLRSPIANLRPRIVDVVATKRARLLRVPDILLLAIKCGGDATDPDENSADTDSHDGHASFEDRLPFQLYRDLKDSESSVLPSLPDTAVRIQLAIEDDLSGADAVARLVATDPAMAAKLIRIANSALYGGRSPVETLTAAVVRLGMQATRQLVLTFALKEVFRTRDKRLRQRMRELWEHSAQIAATCFVLAREVDGVNPEEALLVGLVHDIGAIPVINYASHDPQHAPAPEGLEQTISCMRSELGALILRQWRFAPAVVIAVRDAEFWMRGHEGAADFTDLLIVAQVHERLRMKEPEGLPPVEDIPAFAKVLGADASPQKSLVILHQAEILADQMRAVLCH